jgi:hypothetical protein
MGKLRRGLADMPGAISMIDEIEEAEKADPVDVWRPMPNNKDDKAN